MCEWIYYLTEDESPHSVMYTTKCLIIDGMQISENLYKIRHWLTCPYCGYILTIKEMDE